MFQCQLLSSTSMAVQPLAMDFMGSACHSWAKLHRDKLEEAPANDRQVLLLAPILSPQHVDVEQAREERCSPGG